jgi:hypothetical protein
MNANPFIKPEVGEQSANYVSQYVPLPFEMMQKKADIMQKELDLNNAKGAAAMGMLKVDAISQKEKEVVDARLKGYEDRVRAASTITNPSEQSEVLNALGEEIHADLTRGDLAHVQARYNEFYGKGGYSEKADKFEEKYGAGDLAKAYKARTLADYEATVDPKDLSKSYLNPYPMNKAVDPVEVLMPKAAAIRAVATSILGPASTLQHDKIHGQFLKYIDGKRTVVSESDINKVFNAIADINPELSSHWSGNVKGLMGDEEYQRQRKATLAALVGMYEVDNTEWNRDEKHFSDPVDEAARKKKLEEEDIDVTSTTGTKGQVPEKDMFLGAKGDNMKKYYTLKTTLASNTKEELAKAYRSTLKIKTNSISDAQVDKGILETLRANGLIDPSQKDVSSDTYEQFMRSLADGTIKKVLGPNGIDIFNNNRTAFLNLKNKAIMNVNKAQIAEKQFEAAALDAGFTEKDVKDLHKANEYADLTSQTRELLLATGSKKLAIFASDLDPLFGDETLAMKVQGNDILKSLLNNPEVKANKRLFSKVKDLEASYVAKNRMKNEGKKDLINQKLDDMTDSHGYNETNYDHVQMLIPGEKTYRSVSIPNVLGSVFKAKGKNLLDQAQGLDLEGKPTNITSIVNSTYGQKLKDGTIPKGLDAAGEVAAKNQIKDDMIKTAYLSGTKTEDGYHQIILSTGTHSIHVPVTFGSEASPKGGFNIGVNIHPDFSDNINLETRINNLVKTGIKDLPLGADDAVTLRLNNMSDTPFNKNGTVTDGAFQVHIDLNKFERGTKGQQRFLTGKAAAAFIKEYDKRFTNLSQQEADKFVKEYLDKYPE